MLGWSSEEAERAFALEALESLAVVREGLGKKLKSDMTTETQIFGLEHLAHAASAEFTKNFIVGDGFATHSQLTCRVS